MKHTNKWLMAVAITASAALALTGCTSATDDEGTAASSDITVGFSVYDMQYEFFQSMAAGTKEAVEANGWTYVEHDEKSDENEMVTGAIALLDSGIDVLIISPFKPDALGSIVDHAKELGVPVIVDDIGGGGTDYDAIVVSDNRDGGVQAADYIDETITALGLTTSQKVVSITCQPDAVYAAERNIGFEEQITSLGYDVATSLSGDSDAAKAYTIMKDALAKDSDVVAVFACNDDMAVAASNAITDAGKTPGTDIIVVGYNGDPTALEAIQGGTVNATIAQDPNGMGKLTVELAKTILDGGTISFGNDANREVYNPVALVTAANVADFLG